METYFTVVTTDTTQHYNYIEADDYSEAQEKALYKYSGQKIVSISIQKVLAIRYP